MPATSDCMAAKESGPADGRQGQLFSAKQSESHVTACVC